MLGLEYLLLFGVPENKIEGIYEGRTLTCAAFPTQLEAEQHFEAWLDQLRRWQGGARRQRRPGGRRARVGRFELSRHHCVVRLLVPLNWNLLFNSSELQYDRQLWSVGQGIAPGVHPFDLHARLERATPRHFSGTELLLTPECMVAPISYTFPEGLQLPKDSPEGQRGLVGQHYYQGVPDLIVEELRPLSEAQLRGEKMKLYGQAGLPELWLLQLENRQVEVFTQSAGSLVPAGSFGPGQPFPSLGTEVDPADILPAHDGPCQLKLWKEDDEEGAGLQQFLLAGLPMRSYEFYHGLARRLMACPSLAQAEKVETQVRLEIARWDPGGQLFSLSRTGRTLRLDVRIDPQKHRRLFRYWHFTGNWR